MRPTQEDIVLAYQLFLNRSPSSDEASRMVQNVKSIDQLRRIFLNAPEFELKRQVAVNNNQNPRRGKTLIHLHIPKTAGTSLNLVLGSQYAADGKLTVSDNTLNKIRSLPPTKKFGLEFLFGHMTHGVHKMLQQDCLYLCVLRKPGERLLSFYNYITNTPEHPYHEDATTRHATFGAFLEFAADHPEIRTEFDNGQLRRIGGDMTIEGLGKEKVILKRALANILASDCIYGFTEDFAGFQRQLVYRGILPKVMNIRRNEAPAIANLNSELLQMNATQRDIFEGFIQWDNIFYDTCRDLSLEQEVS